MKKNICFIAMALVIAAAAFSSVSCTDEFQVQEKQLYGKWYFPLNLAPDTITGFNWAGAEMVIKAPDTMLVNAAPGKTFLWTLRGNSVTATCKPRANVAESWVVAFTVYELGANSMKITGKYRYLYDEDNTAIGDITCTLTHSNPALSSKE